ncbi:hypothetical protein J6590_010092 [Homalodisca vitripennis]|nr:hypothetical protein J6590_010092 [Homalodisca vitripennis]
MLQEVEVQLVKEKDLQRTLRQMCEDQDREMEAALLTFDKENENLKLALQEVRQNKHNVDETRKSFKTTEIQTDNSEFTSQDLSLPLILDVAQLKARQELMERSFEVLQNQLQLFNKQKPTASPLKLTQNTPFINRKSQVKSNYLNVSGKTHQGNINSITGKKKNMFSVSLQVVKAAATSKILQPKLSTNTTVEKESRHLPLGSHLSGKKSSIQRSTLQPVNCQTPLMESKHCLSEDEGYNKIVVVAEVHRPPNNEINSAGNLTKTPKNLDTMQSVYGIESLNIEGLSTELVCETAAVNYQSVGDDTCTSLAFIDLQVLHFKVHLIFCPVF